MNRILWRGLFPLLISMLACEPVIAIGWREIIFVFILMAILLGPPLYRFIRKLEELRKQKDK
jgi:hypothetical protein